MGSLDLTSGLLFTFVFRGLSFILYINRFNKSFLFFSLLVLKRIFMIDNHL